MEWRDRMAIRIIHVDDDSVAVKAGLKAGDSIARINREDVLDEIDYQALVCSSNLELDVIDENGQNRTALIRKEEWEPLGITLDESVILKPRYCANRCVFCFVEQMRPGMRPTLYVKDDDWRLSLMMGNYITLTNVDDQEFSRILKRKVSPLYISVHATDPEIRCALLRNPKAGNLMERLRALKENGQTFHCQIVLCPGLNDGEVLRRSIEDLASLWPAAESLAIVPVGLTRFREKLTPISPVDPETAANVLNMSAYYQRKYLDEFGTRFVFPSDEFYLTAGAEIPTEAEYEGYPQIENGVGMLRMLAEDADMTAEDLSGSPLPAPRRIIIPTGVSAAPWLREICRKYAPNGTEVTVIPIVNHFFGETVSVTGLLTGTDLAEQLSGLNCDEIVISSVMLRENEGCFLDDMTVEMLSRRLGKPIRVSENTGEGLIRALYGMEDI